jgi:hypothetical protein
MKREEKRREEKRREEKRREEKEWGGAFRFCTRWGYSLGSVCHLVCSQLPPAPTEPNRPTATFKNASKKYRLEMSL